METNVLNNNNINPDVKKHIANRIERCQKYVSSNPELRALIPTIEKTRGLLPDLKIKKGSRYIIKEAVKYERKDKTIYIGEKKDGIDYDHVFLTEIIKANLDHPEGKNAIGEGLSSLIATNAVGNDSDINLYMDEEITVDLLSRIVGVEQIVAYSTTGNKTMLKTLEQYGISEKETTDFLNKLEYNYNYRKSSNVSNLADIQNTLIDMFFKKPDLNKEETENFGLQLFGNPLYAPHQEYKNIETVYANFDKAASNLEFGIQRTR